MTHLRFRLVQHFKMTIWSNLSFFGIYKCSFEKMTRNGHKMAKILGESDFLSIGLWLVICCFNACDFRELSQIMFALRGGKVVRKMCSLINKKCTLGRYMVKKCKRNLWKLPYSKCDFRKTLTSLIYSLKKTAAWQTQDRVRLMLRH